MYYIAFKKCFFKKYLVVWLNRLNTYQIIQCISTLQYILQQLKIDLTLEIPIFKTTIILKLPNQMISIWYLKEKFERKSKYSVKIRS